MYSTDLAHIHDAGFGAFATHVAPDLARLLRQHDLTGGTIVEMGCGSGAVARYLSECGYDVRGFDISAAMVRLARAKAPRARFRVASLTDARIPRAAAIIAVGEVVTYVPGGMPALRQFFQRAHQALQPGGVLLFDFIESARRRTYPTKTLGGRGWAIAVRAEFEESSQILTRTMATIRRVGHVTRRSRETHYVRIYSRDEVASALESAGFRVTMREAFGRRRLIAGDVAVVARKPERTRKSARAPGQARRSARL